MKYLLSLLVLLSLGACVTGEPSAPPISRQEIERKLPSKLGDKPGWADDIVKALDAIDKEATAERVCAVIAVIGQESGFQENPTVRDLPSVVRSGIEKRFEKLGMLAGPARGAILAARAPGAKETFEERVGKLKAEKDLDIFFRDVEASFRGRFPGSVMVASAVSKLLGKGWIEDMNPVTTAGSMQVKVAYAKSLDEFRRLSDAEARDMLYTRAGGVRAGAARLLDYDAAYDDVIYRFADYNAGFYASRNAAFQSMLSTLTGQKLALDGDLLLYDEDGDASDEESQTVKAMRQFAKTNALSDWTVRRGAGQEKEDDFEDSGIWESVRDAYTKKTGKPAPYAQMPVLTLASPKLTGKRSTEWFAKNVKRRYDACRKR